MIEFEHGALRRTGEPQLAGFIAHAVMDHRDARAFSFLAGAAALNLEQWSEVIAAEVERRRFRKQDLDRAVRRLRAVVTEDAGTPLRSWIVGFIDEVGFQVKRECGAGADEQALSDRTYRTIVGMLTAASFAVLYGEKIGQRQLALIYQPFESFIPLASLG